MILNSYAVLDAFVSCLRLVSGVAIVWLALGIWRSVRRFSLLPHDVALENRAWLLFLVAGLLVLLNVISWPLFYLLLQSYVPEWPGVMCIYGVTRIGIGSMGAARFLPALLQALEILKPLLVFVSGCALVLHWLNRQSTSSPLLSRIVAVVLATGVLGIVDSSCELSYLAIPKKEEMPVSGCCTVAFDSLAGQRRLLPEGAYGQEVRTWLGIAFYVCNLGMALMLLAAARSDPLRALRGVQIGLLGGAILSQLLTMVFVTEIAAPQLLGLPNHHCPYDLLPAAPEGIAALALFWVGSASVGWGVAVLWLANHTETSAQAFRMSANLFYTGFLGYAGSSLMLTMEMLLT